LSGNMLSEVPRHEACIDVRGTCRGITDDKVDGLAAIERFDGLSAGGSRCEDKDSKSKSASQHVTTSASADPAGVLSGFNCSELTCRADFHVRHDLKSQLIWPVRLMTRKGRPT